MPVSWDAVILTGGRATRLDGADKASLVGPDGRTCLQRTIDACSGASSRVVVGRPCDDPRVVSTREDPPYSGPARAIRAGLAVLSTSAYKQESFPEKAVKCWNLHAERTEKCAESNTSGDFEGRIIVLNGGNRQDARWIMVLACDMPHVGQAIPLLLGAAESASTDIDGIVSVSEGHPQWLCALYRRSSLALACSRLPDNGTDESVRSLVAGLSLSEIPIPEAVTQDIDTPADLRTLGFHEPEAVILSQRGYQKKGKQMSEFDLVEEWLSELRESLDLTDLGEVDVPALLNVVREVAHGVVHPAGPVAMFAVGYATARAGGSSEALHQGLATVSSLVESFAADHPHKDKDA